MASKYECVRTVSHLGGDALIYTTAVSLNGLSLMATSVVIQTLPREMEPDADAKRRSARIAAYIFCTHTNTTRYTTYG